MGFVIVLRSADLSILNLVLMTTQIFFQSGINISNIECFLTKRGWSGGAVVLGKLPVLGRPTNLDNSRGKGLLCGWGLFGHFFCHLSFFSSFSLSLGDGPV